MFVQSTEQFLVQDAIAAGGQSVDVHIVSNAVENLQDVQLVQVKSLLQHLVQKELLTGDIQNTAEDLQNIYLVQVGSFL